MGSNPGPFKDSNKASYLQEELFDDANINRILLQTKIRQLNQQIPVNRQMKADIVRVSETIIILFVASL